MPSPPLLMISVSRPDINMAWLSLIVSCLPLENIHLSGFSSFLFHFLHNVSAANNIMKDFLPCCVCTKEMHLHKYLNHSQMESGTDISSSHLSFLLDC